MTAACCTFSSCSHMMHNNAHVHKMTLVHLQAAYEHHCVMQGVQQEPGEASN